MGTDPQPNPPLLQTQTPPFGSIALISGAAIAYEILLMRLLSINQWHHFAYMIISVALLGYGVSGTFLTLAGEYLNKRFRAAFISNAALFGVTAVASYAIAQTLPFNALEILWDDRQPFWLSCIYLLLFIPFFCAANCICLCFSRFPDKLHRIYSFDLVGAGAGAVASIILLMFFMPENVLRAVASLGLAAALAAVLELRFRPVAWGTPLLVALFGLLYFSRGLEIQLSEFKGLSQALSVSGATILDRRSSALALLTTVSSPDVPFRHAPGLSLNSPAIPPEQLAVFSDGEGISMITRKDKSTGSLAYLDYLSSALPYHLLTPKTKGLGPHVLVLGSGGGTDVLQALELGAFRVDAVEINRQLVELVRDKFSSFSGGIYQDHRVSLHVAEARGFAAATERQWDLIQVALLDSFSTSAAGLHALSENYVYTTEAIKEYLDRLRPDGLLAFTRWVKLPPRDGLKLFATAVSALEQSGIADPGQHLVMLRSWNTSTLMIRNEPFGERELDQLGRFCQERWFDLIYYPGMKEAEANQFNQLQAPWFYRASVQILGESREAFFSNYKFNVRPASDDRPFFFHYLKWRSLPEILSLKGQGGLPLLEQGYLILIATLVQAVFLSLLLILLPLLFGRKHAVVKVRGRFQILAYFLSLGFAFMLIEIAFIQKFILFLSHPLYAVAVVLSAFLAFAGLGSVRSATLVRKSAIKRIVVGIVLLTALYWPTLPIVFDWLMPMPDPIKIMLTVCLIAPLAYLMGMPFPIGLNATARVSKDWIAWAWGINGCASVVGAITATLLAVHFGFSVVIGIALILYGLATITSPGRIPRAMDR